MKKKLKTCACNVLLLLSSILICFVLAEGIMRFALYLKSQKNFQEVLRNRPVLKPDDVARLGDILQISKYPGVIYELKPDLKATFDGLPLEINSAGWRGKLYSSKKSENVVRIVSLGDSHMFGAGVLDVEKYTNVLENMLNLRFPGKKWEVINMAVPGYNTYMEIETFEKKALAYDPDIVLIEYIGNDLDLPNFILKPIDFTSFKKSFFWAFLKGRMSLLKTEIGLMDAPVFQESGGGWRHEGMNDINRVPERYRYMVGWKGYKSALLKLKKIQRKRGFRVAIYISHAWPESIPEKILELCKQLGFDALYSPQDYDLDLILSKEDPHPSVLGHKVIAENLFNFMDKKYIFDKFLDRSKNGM